jgi:hypothetical protein
MAEELALVAIDPAAVVVAASVAAVSVTNG